MVDRPSAVGRRSLPVRPPHSATYRTEAQFQAANQRAIAANPIAAQRAADQSSNRFASAADATAAGVDPAATRAATAAAAGPTPAQQHRRSLGLGPGQHAVPAPPTPAVAPPSNTPMVSRDPGAQGPTISQRIADIVGRGGPLMQMAETQGARLAQRRGLGSSSIAIGAAQNEVFRAAAPIATAEGQIASTEMLQREANRLQEIMQTRQLTATEQLQLRDIQNQQYQQGRDITSREGLQGRDIASQQLMQSRDLGSRAGLAQAQRELDRHLASLDRETQVRITGMNLDAADRGQVSSLMANYQNTYEQQLAAINDNRYLSGTARAQQIADLRSRRATYLDAISDFYDVDIGWDSTELPPSSVPPLSDRDVEGRGRNNDDDDDNDGGGGFGSDNRDENGRTQREALRVSQRTPAQRRALRA